MWLTVAKAVMAFLGGPAVKAATEAYKAKLDNKTKHEVMAADLASKELSLQSKEAELNNQLRIAQIGKWYEPEHLFGYTLWLYFAKCIVWDKVLHLGSTDTLVGSIDQWAGLIIMTYFGKRGVENVMRIWKS